MRRTISSAIVFVKIFFDYSDIRKPVKDAGPRMFTFIYLCKLDARMHLEIKIYNTLINIAKYALTAQHPVVTADAAGIVLHIVYSTLPALCRLEHMF